MKRLGRKLKFFKQDQSGGVLILVAILLVVLMGMAALTVDVGGLYLGRRQAVNAADASALAAALGNNENKSEEAAREYAEINNDVNFEGIAFTYFGSGQSEKDTMIITVLVSKEVEFHFAPILGFNNSEVLAMASVQQGPGNGLVPFGKMGVICYCCDESAVPDETTNTYDCGCSPAESVYEECDSCVLGYDNKYWKVENNEGNCANPGDEILLKHERWKNNSEFGAGNYHPVRLPGQTGGNDYRSDVAGGYSGTLESIKPGTEIDTEPGNMVGPTGQAMDDRLWMTAGTTYTYEQLKASANPYSYEMLVIIPIVEIISTGSGGGQSVDLKIVGYASFLLHHEEGDDGKQVWGTLFEYLNFDDLKDIFEDAETEGFVIRLIKDPPEARKKLLDAYNSK